MRSVSLCLPAPRSPKKETLINTPSDHLRLDFPSSHAPAPFTYTVLHCNKPPVLPLTCFSVLCLWQKTGPTPSFPHGSPTFRTICSPGGAGHHSAGFTPATSIPSICLCQSHGLTSCLRGHGTGIWNANTSLINCYTAFTNHSKEVFELATGALSVSEQLLRLCQETPLTHEYTMQFRTLAATLVGLERSGSHRHLSARTGYQYPHPDGDIWRLRWIGKLHAKSQPNCPTLVCLPYRQSRPPACFTRPRFPSTRTRLTSQEHARRMTMGLCLYCASADHFIRSCPNRTPRPAVSTLQSDPVISTLSVLTVQLFTPIQSITASALVDSGSSGNIISQDLLSRLRLPRRRHPRALRVETVNGKPLGRGWVKFESPPMKLKIGNLHEEEITFLVPEGPTVDIILGHPWLIHHSPEIQWESSDIIRWSKYCHQHCLKEIPGPPRLPAAQVASTRVESPETSVIPMIPLDYRAFQDVFSKQAATQLPPHRPWDCAIDLLPGYKLPKGRVYSLSIPERKAMEEYIKEALNQGYIRPSSSQAASSFFFVGKKDGGLRPCIDYRALNSQTTKLPYPLPLVPAALEELRGARIFSKLDLRSAYNLVRIREGDEWKMAFITPSGHYEYLVMPYGLSNAPSVFQEFMNEVFREFLHRSVIVYLDDILIYSRNLADHRHHVAQVLQKLRQFHLYLKLEKCEFHRPTVQFLGYIIGSEGIQMGQGKVKAVAEWPTPQTIKELQRFLGFANFYPRFIKGLICSQPRLPPCSAGSPSPCPGVPTPTKPSTAWRPHSARPLFSGTQTPMYLSWWKLTPPPQGRGPCYPNCSASLHASSLAHTIPRIWPQRSKMMILETGSY